MSPTNDRRSIISWALYDWANSAFSCTIMAGLFPVFFKSYWSEGQSVSESTLHLGTANSLESIIVLLLAPALGAVADRSHSRKRFLMFFTALGILATALLYCVPSGHWQGAWTLYVLASVGFAASLIFYDSLLLGVCTRDRTDFVSALGYSLGYLGGGLLFALNVFMVMKPEFFGLADKAEAVKVAFVTVAVWWAVFSIPLFSVVREVKTGDALGYAAATRAGFCQLLETFRNVRRLRVVFWFLLGYWLYIDAVDTVMRMAVDYGLSIGLNDSDLITALLITQFVGFPAAIVFGKLGDRFGAKPGILVAIAVYVGVTIWGYFMRTEGEFYAMAAIIGLVQGGIQSLSRSFYARIIPEAKAAQFFGFYNMMGKFAAVLGPLLMGWVGAWTGSPRASILSLAILLIAGAALLWRVNEEEGCRAAREM